MGVTVLAVVMLVGQGKPSKTIETQRLVLKDKEGVVRATLGLDADQDSVQLVLYDDEGKKRALLLVPSNGEIAKLVLRAGTEHDRVVLAASTKETGLALRGGKKSGRVWLLGDTATVILVDEKETPRTLLGIAEGGRPGLQFLDAKGEKPIWKAPTK